MALVTFFTYVLGNAALGATVAHGLYHGGASRTPNFVVVMANQGSNATPGGLTYTWDSTSFIIGNPAAATANTLVQVMLKKCHTIEDAGTF